MPPIVIASIAMCVGTTIIHGQNQLFFSYKEIRQKYAYKCFSISACWKTYRKSGKVQQVQQVQ